MKKVYARTLALMALAVPIVLFAQTNLALNKSVTVSSFQGAGLEGANAVDGDPATRWSTEFGDPQWLCIDLGSPQMFNSVTLTWETAYASSYNIQVSNDAAAWTTVFSTTSGAGNKEACDFSVTTARYVRMYGNARGTAYGYSIWEFEVYYAPFKNYALNKRVAVSSVEKAECPGPFAVDGDPNTRWASAFSDPGWIRVDLGAPLTFNMIVLNWEAAFGSSYEIQVSNDTTQWTTVYSTATGAGGTEEIAFTATTARYVRMYGRARGTGWGYSLWEFEVYNQPSYGVNLALRRPVRSSSQWLDFADSNAVDGNFSTDWQPDWADTQWIYVDLGSRRAFDMTVLRWGLNCAVSYKIQVANDTVNWVDVYSTTSDTTGGRNICPFTATLARYVRLLTTDKVMIGTLSLCEFQVYCTTSTPVAVLPDRHPVQLRPGTGCCKVNGAMFMFPSSGNMPKSVAIYDLKGKLLGRSIVSGNVIDIHKQFGLSKGSYLLKYRPVN